MGTKALLLLEAPKHIGLFSAWCALAPPLILSFCHIPFLTDTKSNASSSILLARSSRCPFRDRFWKQSNARFFAACTNLYPFGKSTKHPMPIAAAHCKSSAVLKGLLPLSKHCVTLYRKIPLVCQDFFLFFTMFLDRFQHCHFLGRIWEQRKLYFPLFSSCFARSAFTSTASFPMVRMAFHGIFVSGWRPNKPNSFHFP